MHRDSTLTDPILQCITNGPGPVVEPPTLMVTPFLNDVSNDMVMAVDSNNHTTQVLKVCNIQLGNRKTIHITEDDVQTPLHSHLLKTLPTSTAHLGSGTAPRLCLLSKESL